MGNRKYSPRVGPRRFIAAPLALALMVSLSLGLGTFNFLGSSSSAVASDICEGTTSFSFTNGKLGFAPGSANHNNETYAHGNSIASSGLLSPPFYYSETAKKWYQLTYFGAGLNLAIEHGSTGFPPTNVQEISSLSSLTVDSSSGFVKVSKVGSVCVGYGVLKARGVATLSGTGKSVSVENTFTLADDASFVKITTKLTNDQAGVGSLSDVRLWVGTRDDWVGISDRPVKTRGNLDENDGFVQIDLAGDSSNALRVTSGSEGVLFYSTTPGVSTIWGSCCSFINSYRQNPAEVAPVSTASDGSYAILLPIGTLGTNDSVSIDWFYAAGETADLSAVARAVASAGAPAVPVAVPSDQSATVTWEQPTSQDPIIGYRVRYTNDSGASYSTVPTDFQGDSAPREMTVTGLTNGAEHRFQVAALTGVATLTDGAYSSATQGTWSGSSLGVIPGAPTAPSIASVNAGNQRLIVAFSAPTHTGGFAISDYEYSTDNGSTWAASGTTTSPIVIAGLNNNQTYPVQLRGRNSTYSGLASSETSGRPVPTVADAPIITSITPSSASLSIAFTAPSNDGGSAISNYKYSTDGSNYRAFPTAQTSSPVVIEYLSSDGITTLTNGTAYPISLKAVNGSGDSAASNSVTATPSVPIPAPPTADNGPSVTTQPTVTTPPAIPRVIPRLPATPPTQQGPVLRGNVPPAPPSAPVATIGGRSTPIQTQVTGTTGVNFRAGVLSFGVQVQQDQGIVRQNSSGGTEVEVKKGSTTALSGSGLLPRSTVQVFLPLQGSNSKELARIPVDDAGSFSGDAVFATRVNERPLPIGRQVLQVVSLDDEGQQSVVEMTINIAQSSPAPEFDRAVGQVPTLTPGQSVATNAGEPEVVRVTADSAVKTATVDGDGWRMSVNIEGAGGEVSESGEGGALLQFVRDEGIIVTGRGFMPGTRADVWLFSEPTLLGTVDIDGNGEFSGTVMVDGNVVPVGDHTLQLQGVGDDGYVRAANLGVTVSDAVAEVTTEEAAGRLLWWLVALIAVIGLAAALTIWQMRSRRV